MDNKKKIDRDTRFAANLAAWLDITTFCENLQLANLRRKIGPDGDLVAAHKAWHEAQVKRHERDFEQLARAFAGGERGHAR